VTGVQTCALPISAGASKSDFRNILHHAFKAGASGFLAGRAIWLDAFANYPDWEAIQRDLNGEASKYMSDISRLADEEAVSWYKHSCFGETGARFMPGDASFRHNYAEM